MWQVYMCLFLVCTSDALRMVRVSRRTVSPWNKYMKPRVYPTVSRKAPWSKEQIVGPVYSNRKLK